ncbi:MULTISPECIES: hypothetical protein [Kitasatospora]|uniref:Secreted protein n=2 Tax=Kitasatospora TaxID=2063 RepID=A0ABT1J945_9ACTN|nr:hypothetical protein [Kitasatospora paracochleata]MCP2313576.1 hypothetical protein [Kitasatospora paracochleata]
MVRVAAVGAVVLAGVVGGGAGSAGAIAPVAEGPAQPQVNQGYSIPVGAITDLGALPTLGGLGYEVVGLLGGG